MPGSPRGVVARLLKAMAKLCVYFTPCGCVATVGCLVHVPRSLSVPVPLGPCLCRMVFVLEVLVGVLTCGVCA